MMAGHAGAGLLLSVLLLAGCVSPPKVDLENFNTQLTTLPEVQARWWSTFDDALVDQLVGELHRESLDIKTGLTRVQEVRAQRLSSEAVLLPGVDAVLSTSRGNSQIGTRSAQTLSRGLVEVSWEADLFGANKAGLDTADSAIAESVANAFDVRRLVVAELVQSVLDWRHASNQLEQQRQLLMAQEGQASILRKKVQAGLIDGTALEKTLAQLEQTAALINTTQAQRQSARYRAERLLGKKPDGLASVFMQDVQPAIHLPKPQEDFDIPIDSIRNRPDVMAAAMRLGANAASVRQAEADFWPKLRLSSLLGVQETSEGLEQLTASNPVWALSSSLTAPLLNRRALQGRLEVANARESRAAIAYENAVLVALQESQTFLTQYLSAYNSIRRQQMAIERSQANLQIAMTRHRTGLTDYLPVLVAEQELIAFNLELIRLQSETSRAYIGFRRAIAG
jgi:NodT family efflux transporter outer membrane factor (OMF) lipoprotein